jgi:hypothetical protein
MLTKRRTRSTASNQARGLIEDQNSAWKKYSRPWRSPAAKLLRRCRAAAAPDAGVRTLQPMSEDHPLREHSKHSLAVEVLTKDRSPAPDSVRLQHVADVVPRRPPQRPCGTTFCDSNRRCAAVRTPGRFFVHRNLRQQQTDSGVLLLTRGDAMPHPDEPVAAEELLGRIVSVERGQRAPVPVPRCSPARRFSGLMHPPG